MTLGKSSGVELLKKMTQLNPIEFLGICKILGVSIYELDAEGAPAKEDAKPRPFEDIWIDVCEKLTHLNRVQRRNLSKLLKAATKKEK